MRGAFPHGAGLGLRREHLPDLSARTPGHFQEMRNVAGGCYIAASALLEPPLSFPLSSSLGSPERWLEDHGPALYKFALSRTRDPHKAEEAVRETLLAALQAQERYTGAATLRIWLIGILKHKLLDMVRREAREAPLDEPEWLEELNPDDLFDDTGHWKEQVSDWGDPEEQLARGQFLILLQRCLDALPERLGRLFYLREVLEEETENICQELTITPTNLWTMLYRARLGLRRCLDSHQVGLAAWGG